MSIGLPLPIETIEQVLKVIDYYRARWVIETFFRTLKTGCQVEKIYLETGDRLRRAVATAGLAGSALGLTALVPPTASGMEQGLSVAVARPVPMDLALQDLDGRKIVLILDTCHSGGQAANEKGLRSLDGAKAIGALDLFDNELRHMKDIGQKETALLMSSRAAQVSLVRRQGDLSVMTKFLIEMIREADGPLTLVEAATP